MTEHYVTAFGARSIACRCGEVFDYMDSYNAHRKPTEPISMEDGSLTNPDSALDKELEHSDHSVYWVMIPERKAMMYPVKVTPGQDLEVFFKLSHDNATDLYILWCDDCGCSIGDEQLGLRQDREIV